MISYSHLFTIMKAKHISSAVYNLRKLIELIDKKTTYRITNPKCAKETKRNLNEKFIASYHGFNFAFQPNITLPFWNFLTRKIISMNIKPNSSWNEVKHGHKKNEKGFECLEKLRFIFK